MNDLTLSTSIALTQTRTSDTASSTFSGDRTAQAVRRKVLYSVAAPNTAPKGGRTSPKGAGSAPLPHGEWGEPEGEHPREGKWTNRLKRGERVAPPPRITGNVILGHGGQRHGY